MNLTLCAQARRARGEIGLLLPPVATAAHDDPQAAQLCVDQIRAFQTELQTLLDEQVLDLPGANDVPLLSKLAATAAVVGTDSSVHGGGRAGVRIMHG